MANRKRRAIPRRRNGGKKGAGPVPYQYHMGMHPWHDGLATYRYNPNGDDTGLSDEDFGGGFDLSGVQTSEEKQQTERREEKRARREQRDASGRQRVKKQEEIIQTANTRKLRKWKGKSWERSETPMTPVEAKANLELFVQSLSNDPSLRLQYQKLCDDTKKQKQKRWANLQALGKWVAQSYIRSQDGKYKVSPDVAFKYLVCLPDAFSSYYKSGDQDLYGEGYGQWKFVDLWLDYIESGRTPDRDLPAGERATDPYNQPLVPHGDVETIIEQAIVEGTGGPAFEEALQSDVLSGMSVDEGFDEGYEEEEYAEDVEEPDIAFASRQQRTAEPPPRQERQQRQTSRQARAKDIGSGAYKGRQKKAAKEWSDQLSRVQKERFDARVRTGRSFNEKLFAPFQQFLELQRRTVPVPPIGAFLDSFQLPPGLDDPYAFAKGSIILVVRWNGNTQVIIPSMSSSTVLGKRGRRSGANYEIGDKTWFPIAEFISRPDLQGEAERYGGDVTSLGQAYMFTLAWRTRDPRQDKYLKYPVHIFISQTDDPTVGTSSEKEAQNKIELQYAGTRQPPTVSRFRMADKGMGVAQKIVAGEIGSDSTYGQDPIDTSIFGEDFERFNNPRRRRRRLLPNYASRIRRGY